MEYLRDEVDTLECMELEEKRRERTCPPEERTHYCNTTTDGRDFSPLNQYQSCIQIPDTNYQSFDRQQQWFRSSCGNVWAFLFISFTHYCFFFTSHINFFILIYVWFFCTSSS
jgi:hypothetical protein